MKYLVCILLLAIGATLLGVGYSNYSALVARENSWNENQAKFDETNWQLAHSMGTESRWKSGPKKEFDKKFPMILMAIGGISSLLGLFSLALPSDKSPQFTEPVPERQSPAPEQEPRKRKRYEIQG